ncbi:MAG: GlmU family protein [Bacteroidota bacterium]|nr:GlmU family protein [Bacteroidota bacterium]
MNVVLFDTESNWKNLLPLTFTRPISEIRIGALTIKQKWEKWLKTNCGYLTQVYLQKKYPLVEATENLFINSTICPTDKLVELIINLKSNQLLTSNGEVVAFVGTKADLDNLSGFETTEITIPLFTIKNVWDVFQKNGDAIKSDLEILCINRKSQPLSNSVTVIGDKNLVFLEEGAKAEACILNTTTGPIYLDKDSEIMEGSVVRGPFVLGEHSALKLCTKIYGATTIGPQSKVGGEVNNSVIFGYSNKAHDGFIGNSVVGEWCNLGADTNNSNLKNNYGNVKLYNYLHKKSVDTGLQFCGLIMGDYSKTGINTMLNTGTVVGVGANIFGGGFPPTLIPSFSWGGAQGFDDYQLEKLFETSEKVYERRGLVFTNVEKEILSEIKKAHH